MKTARMFFLFYLALILPSSPAFAADAAKDAVGKLRVLVVTGGHDFEKEPFFKVFKDNPDITFQAAEHPNAHALLKPDAAAQYDVLVCYDMHQEITDEAKADFVARLKEGKGLVVLHHAIASYQQWPEYWKIIGARYYLQKTMVDGVEKARSAYKHGMHFQVHVADPTHAVTRGVKDFELLDETYRLFDVAPDCHTLLTTEEPESNKVIGWAKTYENARVVYLQSGHDHFAYENPGFQKILRQAIRWTAKRD
jgi:type 1 glutamine amidotransferase